MSESKLPTFEQLTAEQQEVVRVWGKGLAVLAGAGSGKTTTLVIKCAELLKLKPEARFAAVSFTERSAADLRAKLSLRMSLTGEGGSLSGHWVMTIHGLCAAIIREYPREAGFDGEETMLSEPESQLLWEKAIETLWQDELPPGIEAALETILGREGRDGTFELLKRVRSLESFGSLGRLAESGDAATRALGVVSAFVLERYDRLKRRRGSLDFDDLERGADQALGHAPVREAFARRFELVLVDEFQDTNPLQARLIRRFVRPDQSNLCVVGDPKQSIYRFRDADVGVFEEFCALLPERRALTWNFRSRPGIIEFVNQVCEPAFEASKMPYEALVAQRAPDPEVDREGNVAPAVGRIDAETPERLAHWVRAEMARGVPLDSMTMLLRSIRGGNEKWLKALTAAGIPIAVGSGGFFWDDPRVRELVALLKWWDQPGNALSGAIFLRAPWVGIADTDLDAWIKRDPTWCTPFFESAHPIAQALRPLRSRAVRPGEVLLALLVSEAVENEIGVPCLGLWHRLEDFSARGLDFHGVVMELSLALEESRREREVPPPKALGQLSILTLHASKGLEFPNVILVDLGKKPRARTAPMLFWDRERGVYLTGRDADGEKIKPAAAPELAAWAEMERSKELAESKRLFYVALTRAQERLILVCPVLEDAEFDPEKAYTQIDWRAWIECSGVEIARLTGRAGQGTAVPQAMESRPAAARARFAAETRFSRPRHSVTEWNMLSRCPRAYEWTHVRPSAGRLAPGFDPESLKAARPGISGRELGTRVHACLERGDLAGLERLEAEVGQARLKAAPLIAWAETSELMARPGHGPGEGGGREVWTELAFEIPVEGEILVGSIDRLVRDETGYTVVDFKITEKAKSAAELLETYATQMNLYAAGVAALEAGGAGVPIRGVLVNISPGSIQHVPVGLDFSIAPGLARAAREIVAGAAGKPLPGPQCGPCPHRGACPESRSNS